RWALPLTTGARCETTLDVMDIITYTDAPPEASPVAAAVVPAAAVAGRKYAVELIGTFFLVFTIATSVLSASALAPLAIGAALMVMIYAGGHISGGHYNPAVTIAALVRGRIGLPDAIGYWIAQLVGGLLAAAIARWVIHPAQLHTLTLSGHLLLAAFVAELLFTFALCYVVLNVATSNSHPNNSLLWPGHRLHRPDRRHCRRRTLRWRVQPRCRHQRRRHWPLRLAHTVGLPRGPDCRRRHRRTHLPHPQPQRPRGEMRRRPTRKQTSAAAHGCRAPTATTTPRCISWISTSTWSGCSAATAFVAGSPCALLGYCGARSLATGTLGVRLRRLL
ncbi:MAG TPA: aquaporin, partial [Pseudonocardiaceae bacterium]|nr:aquaporin [Pseudonocardiaceae bacterium]